MQNEPKEGETTATNSTTVYNIELKK